MAFITLAYIPSKYAQATTPKLTMYAAVLMLVLLVVLWARVDTGEHMTELQQYRLDKWLEISHFETQQLTNSGLGVPLTELGFTGVHPARDNGTLNPFIPKQLDAEIAKMWESKGQEAVFYNNVSSILQGRYIQGTQVPKQHMDASRYNISIEKKPLQLQQSGSLQLVFGESYQHRHSGYLQATAYFAETPADMYGFNLGDGKIVLTTKSLKFSGLKALPFLIPHSEEIVTPGAHDAKALLQEMIHNDTKTYTYMDFDSRVEGTARCEWVMYGRLRRIHLTREILKEVEDELREPMGRPIPNPPLVKFSGVLYSPDCGLTATIKAGGERTEEYKSRLKHALVTLLGIFIATYALTVHQLQRIATPMANFRVSFWSIALTVLADGLVSMICMLGTYRKEIALQLMAILVIVFCFVTTIQLDFLTSIFQSQLRRSDMTFAQTTAMINSRMYIAMVSLFMLVISSYGFSDHNRKIVEWSVTMVLYSYWWPQVYRNARHGFSRPFGIKFIYFTSALRLAPLMYLCFYPRNVGYHAYDPDLGYALLGWQWLQVMVITAQFYLGGQFFVPSWFVIDGYDYHPILSADREAALHTSELPLEDGGDGTKKIDCPVCMNSVTIVTTDDSSASTVLMRRAYMVTPCNHIFHTECLEEWMLRKLECPVCRAKIPTT